MFGETDDFFCLSALAVLFVRYPVQLHQERAAGTAKGCPGILPGKVPTESRFGSDRKLTYYIEIIEIFSGSL